MAEEVQIDLVRAIRQYTDETKQKIFEAEDRIAREMLQEVIDTSPVRYKYKTEWGKKRAAEGRGKTAKRPHGQYQRGWRLTTVNKPTRRIMIVRNVNDPQLAHLLDLGHTMPDGTEYEGTSHISKAQDKANDKLTAEIERILR